MSLNGDEKMISLLDRMSQVLKNVVVDKVSAEKKLESVTLEMRKMEKKLNLLEKAQTKNLVSTQNLESDVRLTANQKENLNKEIKEFCNIGSFVMKNMDRVEDLDKLFSKVFFQNIIDKVKDKCPMLFQIVETFVITSSTSRNTGKKNENYKLKCAVQLLFAMADIRNQSNASEFSKMLGLLLMANGAGKSMLNLLEPIGLCMSYQ